jgi:prepilin-type N-terminal cleavage/methylation domain-containing protein
MSPVSVRSATNARHAKMQINKEQGFSLVELLLVVVIVGVLVALAVPAMQRSIRAAESGTTFQILRTISSTQVGFYARNNRFGRLAELNPMVGNGLGVVTGDRIVRGTFVYELTPLIPTDEELKTEYAVTATRNVPGEATYQYELNQSGEITQIRP